VYELNSAGNLQHYVPYIAFALEAGDALDEFLQVHGTQFHVDEIVERIPDWVSQFSLAQDVHNILTPRWEKHNTFEQFSLASNASSGLVAKWLGQLPRKSLKANQPHNFVPYFTLAVDTW
jgi:glutamate mutase epsilon subunit